MPKKKKTPSLRNHLAAALQSKIFHTKVPKSKKEYSRKEGKKVTEMVDSINTPDDSEGN